MVAAGLLGAACIIMSTVVEAHGNHAAHDSALFAKRSIKARACASQIGAQKRSRAAVRKRDLELKKRGLRPGIDDTDSVYEIHAPAPHYDYIKNTSLVMMPEATEGPYWFPASQIIRQDMSEDQAGVPLVLDIGVVDVNTCAPMEGVLIDLWHCNATGSYSSFTGRDPNIPFTTLLKEANFTFSPDADFRQLATDDETFLRGMWPTDSHGVTSMKTIFPGFYVQRTIHIHAQVHTNWNVTMNGTISQSDVVETAQIFFPEDLSAKIMAMEPYASHTQIGRFPNLIDGVFLQVEAGGADALADVEPLDGEDYANGVLGYITFAVDPSTIRNGSSAPLAGWGVPATNASYYSEWIKTWTTLPVNQTPSPSASTTAA